MGARKDGNIRDGINIIKLLMSLYGLEKKEISLEMKDDGKLNDDAAIINANGVDGVDVADGPNGADGVDVADVANAANAANGEASLDG